jgi:hypothetical protein
LDSIVQSQFESRTIAEIAAQPEPALLCPALYRPETTLMEMRRQP